MFYLSVTSCFFLVSKWASQNTVKPSNPWKRIDVLITLLLAAPVLFLVQVLPRKGAITSFLTKFQTLGDHFTLSGLMIVLGSLAHRYLMKDPGRIEAWLLCFMFLALVLFIVLHATKEVSNHMCGMLFFQQFSLVVANLVKRDYASAIACAVTGSVCFVVMHTEFGGAEVIAV